MEGCWRSATIEERTMFWQATVRLQVLAPVSELGKARAWPGIQTTERYR